MADTTVSVMPQSDEQLLCIRLQGMVIKSDYIAHCTKSIEDRFAKNTAPRILFYYSPEFEGWTEDAAAANMETILRFGKFVPKVAFVNPPPKKVLQMKLMPPDMRGREVKFFNPDGLEEAIAWAKAP